jgi:hypothetical protein
MKRDLEVISRPFFYEIRSLKNRNQVAGSLGKE